MQEAPIHYNTISQVASLIEAKELSPVELTEAMLARIDAVDGRYLSYATVMADQAMESARAAETAISAGNYLGPLHGVPIAVKDLCFTNGVRTMGGSKVLRGHVPDFDATVVKNLLAAGAVILGKLNLTEGAMAGYNPEFQIPLNPWNTGRWSGASSSGSGVATAAGLCFGSLGSDTGGSIRQPAALCGAVGMKPTYGLVSRYGLIAFASSLDQIGPMTRSAADAGIMLQVLAGHDPIDPTSLTTPVPNMLEGLDRGIRGVRIGLDERYITDGVDSAVTEGVLAGIKVLEGLGAEVVQVRMPETPEFLSAWGILCQAEAAAAHRETYPSRGEEYGPWFRGWLERGAAVTGARYAEANQKRLACNGLLAEVFDGIDALVCPSMTTTAGPVKPEELYGPMGEDDWTWGQFTIPFDFNGTPTISLPCGLDADGLPLSIQFVGKHLSEPLLCRMGHAFEGATSWHDLHPEV